MPDPPDPKAKEHPYRAGKSLVSHRRVVRREQYAELAVTSNFTFLTGASHPDELVAQAARLGHHAIALTDRNSLAGIVRGHIAAKEAGLQFIVGCRLELTEPDWFSLLVYPTTKAGYGLLCRLLTLGKRRAPKGECFLTLDDLSAYNKDLLAVVLLKENIPESAAQILSALKRIFNDNRISLALTRLYGPGEKRQLRKQKALSLETNIPLVVANDVHYHVPERRPLQDVVTCIKHGCTLAEAGFKLFPNGERSLKSPEEMRRLFIEHPHALSRTIEIAERCKSFSLDELRYQYPDEVCPQGKTPMAYLRELAWDGARSHFPRGVPGKVEKLLKHELTLIEELNYAPYFLTVHDLVRYARSCDILCQGRGAAANSAVCYCLGVTSVDPDRIEMLFERFVSKERNEPPDIDIDFEHERREEVIQYIYGKYGRERAGMTAEVITYRAKSAVRDVGKALGLSLDAVDTLAKHLHRWSESVFGEETGGTELKALGFNPNDKTIRWLVRLCREIIGFPRHLSQHVGGFVMTQDRLSELVPIENAAMPNRTVIEWDKDDIEAMGMLKVDVLGLGMLTCIRKAFSLLERHHDKKITLATIPPKDPKVYDMICNADTVGVFQVESRAQMTMLPRLKPRNYYDLVIEVAIVRPGPIIGDMVHPYLRRRNGEEEPYYPNEKVKAVLGRTLGIPLFQEQAMALAIVAAGFSPGEAELLRRAITAWTSKETVKKYLKRFIQGMLQNGYSREFAEQCFNRLQGFSEYGFPESHAASFALLVYASSWLKRYYPAAFAASLINSQPMGFYAPAQLVRDAQDHGVEVRQVDVNHSDWDCTLEEAGKVLRLGMRLVKGLGKSDALSIIDAARKNGPFTSVPDLWRSSDVHASSLRHLALADGFRSLGLDRQHALWEVQALHGKPLPLFDALEGNGSLVYTSLPPVSRLQEVGRDYGSLGLSLKAHPISFLRSQLNHEKVLTAKKVRDEKLSPHGRHAKVAGLVLFRQRPSTAKGVMFMTLEDETGRTDLILHPRIHERFRRPAIQGHVILAKGKIERQGKVVHVLVSELTDIGHHLTKLHLRSRDFR